MEYFKVHHEGIFDRIKSFEKLNIENYYIDFIDDHFELCTNTGKRIYNCNPFYDADYRANQIEETVSSISMIDMKCREVRSDDSFDFNKFLNQFIMLYEGNEKKIFKYSKFMFIGTLLGIHLNDINSVVQSDVYFIVEKSLEIFRLSLFFTDYESLGKNSKLFFAIELDDMNLERQIQAFLDYKYEFNNLLKYEIASEMDIELFNNISNKVSSLNPVSYPYSEIIRSYLHGLSNLSNSENGLLDLSSGLKILEDKKVLFLAAGPSLLSNITFIKENKNKFVIVSVASALKRLEKEEIIPDIIISIDSDKTVLDSFMISKKYYTNSIIIASLSTDSEVFQLFNQNNTYLIQTTLELIKGKGLYTGVTVGDIGLKILLRLGAKKIYLCGLDAALNQTTGLTHDITHISSSKKDLNMSTIVESEKKDFADVVIKVKGNLSKEVFTTLYYKTVIDSINSISLSLHGNSKIINVSNGAYFNNTIPMKMDNVLTEQINDLDKNLLYLELKSSLENKIFQKSLDSSKVFNSDSILSYVINEYNKLILPYYYYILENNFIADIEDLNKIKDNQLSIILDHLTKTIKTEKKD